MSEHKRALVTGASRGIGKVVATSLAQAGFDVAVTARSVAPGEEHDRSPSISSRDRSPLPGSLRETGLAIEQAGRRALVLRSDITDPASVAAAGTTVLERWGGVDVLVNCARHTGPGHMDTVVQTPLDSLRAILEGNVVTPVLLTQLFLPGMVERGEGTIVNFTSICAFASPSRPAGRGGWGLTYGASKAALHRLAGILAAETAQTGVNTFNVDPGYTWTERNARDMTRYGFSPDGAPPEVAGAVVTWLATNPAATALNGQTIFAQPFCAERGLLARWTATDVRAWSGPVLDNAPMDLAAGRSATG